MAAIIWGRRCIMAVVEISVVPLGTGTPSVSAHVARAVRVLEDEEGLSYEPTPMGTIIEGELDRIMIAVRKMHESAFSSGVMRVVTTIRIDDRRDKDLTMRGKLESLRRETGGKV